MFRDVFKDKKVLITGHTGFKGSWLSAWLLSLGANVSGFSDRVNTNPSNFEVLNLASNIDDYRGDVRNEGELQSVIAKVKPDFIFHLAAQAIVSTSYSEPMETITTNTIGTANILNIAREIEHKCVIIIITSDKCYENIEWEWGYKETDPLGGKDIYSGSKGAAEIIFHSFYEAFFKDHKHVNIASARAGNVIGGGDWATDRIIADAVRSWLDGKVVDIRSPNATRPWQHVLEPLSGYLDLASALWANKQGIRGESFNFGPSSTVNKTVVDLIEELSNYWQPKEKINKFYSVSDNRPFHEATLLKLNCDKALFHLKWEPTLDFSECVSFVGEWYNHYYNSKDQIDMLELTMNQISSYEFQARSKEIFWTAK